MKKVLLLAGAAALFALSANAQENIDLSLPCVDHYVTNKTSNWFIQIGAGAELPGVEGFDSDKHFTASYDLAFGKWFSPYFAWRLEAYGGSVHSNAFGVKGMQHQKMVAGNFDIMWNMFNSIGHVNQKRVFNINPFIGAGLVYAWDFAKPIYRKNVLVPQISAGLQFNFRLCNYVDFFLQGRVMAAADNFNGITIGRPADLNFQAVGGFVFNLGGKNFASFNPCDYNAYINQLNKRNNDLMDELNQKNAIIDGLQAQLPCPPTQVVQECEETFVNPLLGTVRFSIGSAKVTSMEKVNIYNVAEFLKNNTNYGVSIQGYADKGTGNAKINEALSKKRAEAVANILINEYGIDADRVNSSYFGDTEQPYEVNNWNRVVLMMAE